MNAMKHASIFVFVGLLIVGGAAALLLLPRVAQVPDQPVPQHSEVVSPTTLPTPSAVLPAIRATKQVRAADVPGTDESFIFVATIPADWEVEVVPGSRAISFYDPQVSGSTTLDKSQIFIRSFKAHDFLTLSTVTIHSREQLTINGRPAVRYDIEKKSEVPPFAAQPAWRNERHIVTDIRVSDKNPSVFYVIAKRPDLDAVVYETFLQNLQGSVAGDVSSLLPPIDGFRERITKKPFGIYITPATSPVQPERFTGWHTGVDVEYDDVAAQVPVRAIAAGEVVVARTASGYGGVVAIRHTVQGEKVVALYGHLKPASIPRVEQTVRAGEQICVLGEGGTAETDGERKHLHFAVRKDTRPDIRGYVSGKEELERWHNPVELYS